MKFLKSGDEVSAGDFKLTIEGFLGKGKSGYSYKASLGRELFVFKKMHNEQVGYYNFSENKISLERKSYFILEKTGIKIPKLLFTDEEKGCLVKEYIDGLNGMELIIFSPDIEPFISQLCEMYKLAKKAGINIDYFPPNFVADNNGILHYIDYEHNIYSFEWGLEYWGLYYWANKAGIQKFSEQGDPSFINNPPNSGIPLKEPFRERVNSWINDYLK
ncbi:MAG: hypothetical protein IAE91_06715 [Ignavibacteriaceae bacterium]|nr:hypothetical protein [Ignavibacteriaceae bacterium]